MWLFCRRLRNRRISTQPARRMATGRRAVGLTGVVLLWMGSTITLADIRFEDVTRDAGITHAGPTWGASWGDFNGDGWPDLWVANHNTKPCLYLNKQDGTFENIIDRVWPGDPKADTHGAAWADFDNDGDQDLVELVSFKENEDGTFCRGCGKNHLFINENGKLLERAADFGLDHTGQALTPVWFDADRDGLLDLLVVNTRGPGLPASTLYLQKNNRFVIVDQAMNFKDGPWERGEKIRALLENLADFKYRRVPYFNTHRHLEFAQLADLSSDGHLDLILFSRPTRVYKIDATPFKDITHKIGLPNLSRITDVAIADFDGDNKMDMYVARWGAYLHSDVIRTGPSGLKGMLTCSGVGPSKAVIFQAEGDIDFQIHPTWLHLSKVYIGSVGHHPARRSFTLSPTDPAVYGPASEKIPEGDGVSITYDPDLRTWTIRNFHRSIFVDFIVEASGSIPEFQTDGFDPFVGGEKDFLFLQRKDGFVEMKLTGETGILTSCNSVVAGDFDNDMDVDLYLVCSGPVENVPNILLENDGKGNFTVVPDAGGAAGSRLGRGDVVVVADYDRDGFLDLLVTNGNDPTSPFVADGPHQLFRNVGNSNHWLQIDLEGTASNRDGIGSIVEVEAGGILQKREQTGGMHRLAQNHQRLHFGLGSHSRVNRLTVKWPSGIVNHLTDIQADQILHIKESSQDKT